MTIDVAVVKSAYEKPTIATYTRNTLPAHLDDQLTADGLMEERPRLVTLADVDRVVKKTTWHWNRWIPRSNVSICVGRPGIGKSVVVLDLIKRMLTGGTWPDGSECPRLESVMWLDAEGTQAILVERCKTLGIPLDKIVFPFPLGTGSPEEILRDLQLDSADWQTFQKSLGQHRPGLLVIDSLSGTHQIEEKDCKIGRLVKEFQLLARDTETAILGIHHIRKAGPGAVRPITIDDVRGHGGIAANARVIWCLEPNDLNDPEGQVKMKSLKSNISKPGKPLGLHIEEQGRIRWADLEKVEAVRGKQEQANDWLRSVLSGGSVPSADLDVMADQAGHSASSIDRAKKAIGTDASRESGQWFTRLGRASGKNTKAADHEK